ncbi:hypothetical protein E4665_11835 [Sporolactobacillus shoreae]|uniref:Extracellular solute-binding protein n=1 Tax=Sporolactobacillus shoreae TaxID=1465501 RepID=A0A4Z0GKW1_9BACL|nr:substrate-binding domain-containing protein [Sporolactobacillus shoreae]TGA97529.1 hypothetical protein E4665_11835 [Sporolactobacillus shoreae]
MRNKIIGIAILLLIIGGTFAFLVLNGKNNAKGPAPSKTVTVLKGYIGSEKEGLLSDPAIQNLLKNDFGVQLDYAKAGSIAMVEGSTKGQDFLFPSSQTALEIFKQKQPDAIAANRVEFNSPLVLYSWDTVTNALIKQGIVQERNGTDYVVDMPKLISMVNSGKKWADIGLPSLYGNVNIQSTDPTQSNSGNQFAGLLADILNNGQVVDDSTVQKVLPQIKTYFGKQGYQQTGSGDIFEQYLTTGVGAYPLIVGYENQLIEFAAQNPQKWQQVKSKMRILYPVPTVWSSHTFIALNDKAKVGLNALASTKIQNLAWTKHGFRSGDANVVNDTSKLPVSGIPSSIDQVIGVPKPSVMDTIINALKAH